MRIIYPSGLNKGFGLKFLKKLQGHCDNIPAGGSPLSRPPKPFHGYLIVLWFLSSPAWGISHCFTNTQETTYTTERVEEKKNIQARTWVSSKCKKGGVLALFCSFLCICGLSRAFIWVKFPHNHQEHWLILSRWPTQPLGPQVLAPCLTAAFLSLLPSFDFCWQLSSVDSLGPCLPLSSSSLIGNFMQKPFVWVSCQNKQRNPLTGTHPHL